MTTNNQLPIAETFHSLQGEGFWVGTPMHFIRLAGCPVGKKATHTWLEQGQPGAYETAIQHDGVHLPILQTGVMASKCQTWDGRFFDCDTDFSTHTYKTVDELIGETTEHHICLTGGEPLVHQERLISLGFFQQAFDRRIMIHIETSGTIELNQHYVNRPYIWITVAPKWNCSPSMIRYVANEVKLLVDEQFDVAKIPELWNLNDNSNIFLSPINGEKEVNQDNVKRCLEILKTHPDWRLSAQWHKFLGLR